MTATMVSVVKQDERNGMDCAIAPKFRSGQRAGTPAESDDGSG